MKLNVLLLQHKMRLLAVCLALCAVARAYPQQAEPAAPATKTYSEEEAKQYLLGLNDELLRHSNLAARAEWAYASNITDETLQNKVGTVRSSRARSFQRSRRQRVHSAPYGPGSFSLGGRRPFGER